MKASNFGFLLSIAVVTAFAACAPTGNKGKIDSKAAAPAGKAGQQGKDQVDAAGFIQFAGAGIFSGEGDMLISKLDKALVYNDKDAKMTADVTDSLKKELAEIAKAKTYMVLGCKEIPEHLKEKLKDHKEVKASEAKDSVSHSASVIVLCGKADLPALATLKANGIYMQDAVITAASKSGKLVVSTNYLYLVGTKNTFNAPLKAGATTSIDLSVAVKISRIQDEGSLRINLNYKAGGKGVRGGDDKAGIVKDETDGAKEDKDSDSAKIDDNESVEESTEHQVTSEDKKKDPDADENEAL